MPQSLLLVVPCYNQDEILRITYSKLCAYYDKLFLEGKISLNRKISYVIEGSKYPLKKMKAFSWGRFTSFSTVPIGLVLCFCKINFLDTLSIGVYEIYSKFTGFVVVRWTSIVLPMAFFSGPNLFAIGLFGKYNGKIQEEVKARPRYIVDKKIGE